MDLPLVGGVDSITGLDGRNFWRDLNTRLSRFFRPMAYLMCAKVSGLI